MRQPIILLLCLIAPMLCGAGQVYQSKDAEGNTVFSDMPSAGAEEIKVKPTNSAEPVQDIPALAPRKSEADEQPAQEVTTATSQREDHEHDADSPYWLGGGGDDLDGRDNGVQDKREARRDTPIRDRPRVQPLPSNGGPARGGGAGRR